MVTLTRKEREKVRHQREIVNAAEEVFSEKGFHGATTEEIARRAEFAVGTLYKFFKSKEDIYWAVLRDRMLMRLEFMRQTLADSDADPVRAIEAYIEKKAEFFAQHLRFFRLFMNEHFGESPVLTEKRRAQMMTIYEDSLTLMDAVVRKGMAQGRIRNMAPRDITLSLEGITGTFLHQAFMHRALEEYHQQVPVMKVLFFHGALTEKEMRQKT